MKKDTVISVRISRDLADKFDQICKYYNMGKTEFLEACINKLCNQNEIILEYYPKISVFVNEIKKFIQKIPKRF